MKPLSFIGLATVKFRLHRFFKPLSSHITSLVLKFLDKRDFYFNKNITNIYNLYIDIYYRYIAFHIKTGLPFARLWCLKDGISKILR